MKRFILSLVTAIFIFVGADAQNPRAWRKLKQDINIFWASDLDREGCYDQKVIAELMGTMAGKIKPVCIVSTGDTHHGNGVKSINDSDWKENFEDIYCHPKLDIEWIPALGNHEYRGSTQAVIDYSKRNPNWKMPDHYYTRVFKRGGVSVRFVMIDTTPMIKRYRESEKYADAGTLDYKEQLRWLDKVLNEANEDWVIVAGHHPVYADTKKSKSERNDMRNTVNKVLREHDNVAMYLCGHIHNFQHLRSKSSNIDYIVNSSASQARSVKITKRTVYCSSEAGFSVITASKDRLSVHMIDKNGNVLHSVNRTK